MITDEKCPDCGNNLDRTIKGLTLMWSCASCGYGVATTYLPPIKKDTQRYKVFAKKNDKPDIEYFRIVSRATGLNYLEIKKRVFDADLLIFEGRALAVLPFKQKLEKSTLDFYITPDFIYTNEDLDAWNRS